MARPLRLIAEYGLPPLWSAAPDGASHAPDLDAWALPPALLARLRAWDDAFQATYIGADPGSSAFDDARAEAAHDTVGHELARDVARALHRPVEFRGGGRTAVHRP